MKKKSKKNEEKAKLSSKEIEALVLKLHKEKMPITMIGQTLKDTYGVLSIKSSVGKSVKKILESSKIRIEMPEDLQNLLNNAEKLKKHLEKNKQDKTAERGLLITESKLRSLGKYYKKKGILPKTWQY